MILVLGDRSKTGFESFAGSSGRFSESEALCFSDMFWFLAGPLASCLA